MIELSTIPPQLGSLSGSVVARYLSHSVLAGHENPPIASLLKASAPKPESDQRWLVAPIRTLLDEAMRRFCDKRTSADGWLAPRLHATLRITRSEAADEHLWNYLSMVVAPDYVIWRHSMQGLVAPARFCGAHFTQAFARLWWVAELFRNGHDYGPVEIACSVQDVLNSTMRLDVIDHRPSALAIISVLEQLIASGTDYLGDQINSLSSAVNAAGSTLVYDVIAPDTPVDDEALRAWISDVGEMPPVPWDRLPDGPADGAINVATIQALLPLFQELLAETPKRERSRHSAPIDEE